MNDENYFNKNSTASSADVNSLDSDSKDSSALKSALTHKRTERVKTKEYSVGEKDAQGVEIVYVYSSTPDYIVYRTRVGIRVFIDDDDLPDNERIHFHRFLLIGPELARIYSLQPEELATVESNNRQVARAMQQCLENNLDNARVLLGEARDRLISACLAIVVADGCDGLKAFGTVPATPCGRR